MKQLFIALAFISVLPSCTDNETREFAIEVCQENNRLIMADCEYILTQLKRLHSENPVRLKPFYEVALKIKFQLQKLKKLRYSDESSIVSTQKIIKTNTQLIDSIIGIYNFQYDTFKLSKHSDIEINLIQNKTGLLKTYSSILVELVTINSSISCYFGNPYKLATDSLDNENNILVSVRFNQRKEFLMIESITNLKGEHITYNQKAIPFHWELNFGNYDEELVVNAQVLVQHPYKKEFVVLDEFKNDTVYLKK